MSIPSKAFFDDFLVRCDYLPRLCVVSFHQVFAGVLARTGVPYLVKLKSNPDLKWENKYLLPALAGFALSLITTLLIYYDATHLAFDGPKNWICPYLWHGILSARPVLRSTEIAWIRVNKLGFE